ncbi:MAG: DoxX family protein [Pirellula sp.]
MLLRKAHLGVLAILALVALRIAIGWHFFMEGTDKVQKGGFSSTGFLGAAKGPLAKRFQSMIPDFDGVARLDDKQMKAAYEDLIGRATEIFQFTDEQKADAAKVSEQYRKELADVYKGWKPQIDEYKQGLPRVLSNEKDEMRTNVASMRKQRDDIETKWRALGRPVLSDIDRVNSEFESAINAIATTSQVGETQRRHAAFKLPDSPAIDVKTIDKIIPIFDMCVGILLIVGLLTPLAGLAAGVFLASVVLTQFPGWPGSQPTYYQAIEMVGCFLLAFADAGRYAGLDYLPWSFWNRNSKVLIERRR